jgi:hypothetical protein
MSGETFTHFIAPQPPPLSLDEIRRIIEEHRAPFEVTFGDERATYTINLLDYEVSDQFMPEGCLLLTHRQRRATWIGAPPVRVSPSPEAFLIVNVIEKTITIIGDSLHRLGASGFDDFERRFGLGVPDRHAGVILTQRPQERPEGGER